MSNLTEITFRKIAVVGSIKTMDSRKMVVPCWGLEVAGHAHDMQLLIQRHKRGLPDALCILIDS
jgi:hypothetical protein